MHTSHGADLVKNPRDTSIGGKFKDLTRNQARQLEKMERTMRQNTELISAAATAAAWGMGGNPQTNISYRRSQSSGVSKSRGNTLPTHTAAAIIFPFGTTSWSVIIGSQGKLQRRTSTDSRVSK